MTYKEAINTLKEIGDYIERSNALDIKDKIYQCCEVLEKDLNKLGQLKDIEEELGIDLITLFNALKNGIFVREQNTNEKEIVFEEITLNLDNKVLLFKHPRKEIGKGRNISQYGKTWALTKEELEK